MDLAAAAAVAVVFAAWLGWTGYVHSEQWIKTARRWQKGMTGDGYAKWARKHDGESAEVLLSAVATAARLATRMAKTTAAYAGRRAPSDAQAGDTSPAGGGQTTPHRPGPAPDPIPDAAPGAGPDPAPAGDPAPDPEPGPAPGPKSPRPSPNRETPNPPDPAPAPHPEPRPMGDPMALTNKPNKPNGEIVGLRAVLDGWKRLIGIGENNSAQAGQITSAARNLTASAEALCSKDNDMLTLLGQLEAACYRHALEPAALTRVHEAMEAAGAAHTAQRRAHNALGAATTSLRAAANAHTTAVGACRSALAYLNRTHKIKAEVEASTGARSDRDFGTS